MTHRSLRLATPLVPLTIALAMPLVLNVTPNSANPLPAPVAPTATPGLSASQLT